MGTLIAFKPCKWSENGFCIATSVDACVCHRGGTPRYLAALGRARLKALASPNTEYTIPIHEVSAKECPPPWMAPQGAGDLIAYAKLGAPPPLELLDDDDAGC